MASRMFDVLKFNAIEECGDGTHVDLRQLGSDVVNPISDHILVLSADPVQGDVVCQGFPLLWLVSFDLEVVSD